MSVDTTTSLDPELVEEVSSSPRCGWRGELLDDMQPGSGAECGRPATWAMVPPCGHVDFFCDPCRVDAQDDEFTIICDCHAESEWWQSRWEPIR